MAASVLHLLSGMSDATMNGGKRNVALRSCLTFCPRLVFFTLFDDYYEKGRGRFVIHVELTGYSVNIYVKKE